MGKLNYLESLCVENNGFFKNNVFFCFVFYIYLFLYTRACTSHNKHVEVRGRLWETM